MGDCGPQSMPETAQDGASAMGLLRMKWVMPNTPAMTNNKMIQSGIRTPFWGLPLLSFYAETRRKAIKGLGFAASHDTCA